MATTSEMAASNFGSLPAELMDNILSHLAADDLARVACTCRTLYTLAQNDLLWQPLIEANIHAPLATPSSGSFKDLYVAHHQHWFLTKHRIWFGDAFHTGTLIIALYNQRRRCIEAFSLVAQRAPAKQGLLIWDGRPVQFDTFNPHVYLDLKRSLIRLDYHDPRHSPPRFRPEFEMNVQKASTHPMRHVLLHSRYLPREVTNVPSVQVWPTRNMPAAGDLRMLGDCRMRAESSDCFRGSDHIPSSMREASQTTFRIRQHIQSTHSSRLPLFTFSQARISELISNYGTLAIEAYTPTPEKPWQGIWCGDYNAHGVEFLLITQPDEPRPLPSKAKSAFANWPAVVADDVETLLYGGMHDDDEEDDGEDDGDDAHDVGRIYREIAHMMAGGPRPGTPMPRPSKDEGPYKGRLEAIKLTGDPNIPRGEFSFIVEDIGAAGYLQTTQEPLFNQPSESTPRDAASGPQAFVSQLPDRADGARVVKSVGHIAGHDFRQDTYIATQLIMVSENQLAQFWRSFQHISFYHRVDIDALAAHAMD